MTDDTIEQHVAETQQGFDLKKRLQGIGLREGQITLFTDHETGEALGTARDVKNQLGITVDRVQVGILGDIDKLNPESKTYAEDLAALEVQRDELIAKLQETALVVKLRAVPPIIAKDGRRRAKVSLGIKGEVPADRTEEFDDAFTAHLLSDTIVSIEDVASGAVNGKQTYEDCRTLKEFLPPDQWQRLDHKLAEVQYKEAVSEAISSDTDF